MIYRNAKYELIGFNSAFIILLMKQFRGWDGDVGGEGSGREGTGCEEGSLKAYFIFLAS